MTDVVVPVVQELLEGLQNYLKANKDPTGIINGAIPVLSGRISQCQSLKEQQTLDLNAIKNYLVLIANNIQNLISIKGTGEQFQQDLNHLFTKANDSIEQEMKTIEEDIKIRNLKTKLGHTLNPKQLPKQPWLDIAQLKELFQEDTDIHLSHLIRLIDAYHKLSKTHTASLPERISTLHSIQQEAEKLWRNQDLFFSTSVKETLLMLSQQAHGKMLYLKRIKHIEPTKTIDILKTIFGGLTTTGMIIARNKSDGSAQSEIDPALRTSNAKFQELFAFWKQLADEAAKKEIEEIESLMKEQSITRKEAIQRKTKNTNTIPSFLLWLEIQDTTQNDGTSTEEHYHYKMHTLHETKITSEFITDNEDNKISGKYIYVIDIFEKLHISQRTTGGHPYVAGDGKGVLCAGDIEIKDGKIRSINNNSGHYLPKPFHLEQIIKMLAAKKVFADVASICCMQRDDRGLINTELSILNNQSNEQNLQSSFEKIKLSTKYYIRSNYLSTREILDSIDQSKLSITIEYQRKYLAAKMIQDTWKNYSKTKQLVPV